MIFSATKCHLKKSKYDIFKRFFLISLYKLLYTVVSLIFGNMNFGGFNENHSFVANEPINTKYSMNTSFR